MLSSDRFRKVCKERNMTVEVLAKQIERPGLEKGRALTAVKNWQRGLLKPRPGKEDIEKLASALESDVNELLEWKSCYRWAPMAASKAKLVTRLIAGRPVQDALDTLKFTRKRAATLVYKILKAAIADADEQQADVDNLYVKNASVDDAGVRVGTKRFEEKDRGRAHSIRQRACHIQVTVAEV